MTDATRELLVTPAAQIQSRRQRWLWADRIPLGTVTIFAGRGGEGKSTFGLHIGSETIRGNLPGDLQGTPSPFLVVSHEDDWATVMKPRLIGAGADPEHAYKVGVRVTVDETTHETVPALPIDVDLLRDAVAQTGAKLIMIDPITATIGGDMHKVADVRRALDPLATLAQELEIAVVAIMHFNKGAGNVSDKLSGSHAFRDLSRSVLLFATDEETGQRIVSVDKSNYSAERGSSFAFNLTSVFVETDDGETTAVARVEYLGDTDLNVSDIVNRTQDDDATSDRSEAERWLISFLQDQGGIAAARDVKKAATSDGIEWRTLQRASQRVTDKQKAGYQGAWQWTLNLTKDDTKNPKTSRAQAPDTFGAFDTFDPPSIVERLDLPIDEEVF